MINTSDSVISAIAILLASVANLAIINKPSTPPRYCHDESATRNTLTTTGRHEQWLYDVTDPTVTSDARAPSLSRDTETAGADRLERQGRRPLFYSSHPVKKNHAKCVLASEMGHNSRFFPIRPTLSGSEH